MGNNKEDLFDSGVRIALDIGTPLHLELEGVAMPLQSDFVGMATDRYIIIGSPNLYSQVKHKLFAGNHIIVKYLFNGTVYAFQSKLIETINKPVRLVFLEYPKIVQRKDLRDHKRMTCYFPVKLIYENEVVAGVILDINKKGCRCKTQIQRSDNISTVNIDDPMDLKFPFPGIEGEMQIPGAVTNIYKDGLGLDIGIKFKETSLEVERIISQYILSVYDYI
ncbi:MAG: flagellar brake protein [Deltaproteobacteria bacterium]|nr:flagellar brake protein [Deltaproteobacteria bacterium]